MGSVARLRAHPRRIVVTGGVALVAARAASTPSLPRISPARLIASTVRALAARPSVSGMLVSHVNLAPPSLSDAEAAAAGLSGSAALLGDVNGDHRIRFWSSKDGVKIAELLSTEEISFTLGRSGAWLWSSQQFAVLVISTAYERTSLMVTTDLPFESWTEVLGSERLTGATLDRLTHRCQIIETKASPTG